MPCTLRIETTPAGLERVAKAFRGASLHTFRRGLPVVPGAKRVSKIYGVNVVVSSAVGYLIEPQIRSAQRFLLRYRTQLRRLSRSSTIRGWELDFAVDDVCERYPSISHVFPLGLVRATTRYDLDLVLSVNNFSFLQGRTRKSVASK